MLRTLPTLSTAALLLTFLAQGCRSERDSSHSNSLPATVTVAAASDTTFALREIGNRMRSHELVDVVFSFGSSGLLTQQIESGAPFDVFASASETYVERLKRAGLVVEGSDAIFAQGSLVLWQRSDAPVHVESLRELTLEQVRRFAIANPDHAPYGRAAKEALQQHGLWEATRDKIVYAENIAQAFQFAKSGNVDVAIVARSLVSGQEGRFITIDSNLHSPINQAICILKRSQNIPAARRFVDYVQSSEANAILRKYGFKVPTDDESH